MNDQLVVALTAIVMFIGLAGVVIPVVPGVLLVGTAAIVSTFVLGISAAGWLSVITIALISIGGYFASWALPARRGIRGGAAPSSLVAAVVAGAVGFFVIPVIGLPVGALAGLFLGELQRHGERGRAWASTVDVLRAYGLGILVEFGAALLVILIWLPGTVFRVL